jgi:hypothetical protein
MSPSIESIQSMEASMIPASYLYKDIFTQAWGDPRNVQAEPVECEPRGPSKGRFAGMIGLLASALPLEIERVRLGSRCGTT